MLHVTVASVLMQLLCVPIPVVGNPVGGRKHRYVVSRTAPPHFESHERQHAHSKLN